MKTLKGTMTALATPFKDGQLDESAYRELIRTQLGGGVNGLVPVGTTGEAVTLSSDECARLTRIAVEEAKGAVPVIAGVGSNDTRKTIDNIAWAREAGADAGLVVTPYYNKPSQAGLFAHFQAIAKAHPGFPLVAYNVPGRTSGDTLPETVRRLCDLSEVVAIKEATGNLVRALAIRELCGDRIALLSGDDFTVLPFLASGGVGIISVSSNVVPKLMSDLVQAALEGKFKEALDIQLRLQPLHRALFLESNPIPLKWALARMGLMGGELRLPLTPLAETHHAALEAELSKLGLLS
ncbi:MAG TPA: 4-hydroxy-tetrahydrodipicolinate synthase [Myxococcaceae bacterium]|nr:4-hydroxy-tetrahydrodipicolinate synthase [Myxococcaceae bacterium]